MMSPRRIRRWLTPLLVLALVVGLAVPAAPYANCANATNDPRYLYRDVGTGFPTGGFSITWQQWINADRANQFQTYVSSGPITFDSGNDYIVAFDGDGVTSHNMGVGAEGSDTYSAVLPVVGAWKQMGFRHVAGGGSTWDHKFYYDLAAGVGNQVTQNATADLTWTADNRFVLTNVPWNDQAEGCNCRIRYVKVFSDLLSEADLQTESTSPNVLTGGHTLWAQWPLNTNANDTSGNARHLTNTATPCTFVEDAAAVIPSRMLRGVGQ